MTEQKKVSIVLPTYNGSRYLKEAVDHCLNQTYQNLELIIVDDASNSNTPEIVRSYTDARIKYIRNESNQGLSESLNIGFGAATGKYLTWTSDDNYYLSNALEIMAAELEKSREVGFVYADFFVIGEKGNLLERYSAGKPEQLIWGNCIGPCFLYRADVYRTVGDYNPGAALAEDFEYWLRIRKRYIMKKINRRLYCYRVHRESLSQKKARVNIKKTAMKVSRNLVPSAAKYYLEGEQLYLENDKSAARSSLLKSLLLYPMHFDTLRFLALISLPGYLVDGIRRFKRGIKA